jgi:Ni,Fe-hydrogenase III small subunit/ferredoxin
VSLWVFRGLRDGVVTTRWPARPDEYADSWQGPVVITGDASVNGTVGRCPTGAISVAADRVRVDQGRCILCGRCVAQRPDLFAWSAGPGTPVLTRQQLILPEENDEAVEELRRRLARRTAALRRSVHIRHVDAGSDGSEEWEIQALLGPVYDVQRLGIFFTASPRHADVLLVTGAGTPGMAESLRITYDGMPDPKVVIAVGTDAVSGGLHSVGSYSQGDATPAGAALPGTGLHGIGDIVPVDIWIAGSPPSPFGLISAVLLAIGKLAGGGKGAR